MTKSSHSAQDPTPPPFTTLPTVCANPNPSAPLAALLRFSANKRVQTIIQVSDGEREWGTTFDESHAPEDGLSAAGMRPNRRHRMRVYIRDAAGNVSRAPETVEFTTPPLCSGGSSGLDEGTPRPTPSLR